MKQLHLSTGLTAIPDSSQAQGVPPGKRKFTTLRRFRKKKAQFFSVKIDRLGFFVTQEKLLIVEARY